MNAITKTEAKTDREWNVLWAIRDAQTKAYMEGDGEPQAIHLMAALAEHGLVIVEASKWDVAKTALQVIASLPAVTVGVTTAKVAGDAVKKMDL